MTLLEYADLLETTTREQCQAGFMTPEGTCCAVGLAILAVDPNVYCVHWIPPKLQPVIDPLLREFIKVCGTNVFTLNDLECLTFKQIAALIRAKLKEKDDVGF